ncbi:MAG: hypothetical protein F6J90_27405 [Moorea sp. SIOASIH]|uniref:hypothetical protein n=1 Tax=Moorena sp. SIOASIH TaxID=2607817 RepID=UPI0013BCA659|nr:hypothetical protein [Moorena sp. SIOASIH]NEO39858.1 hypothetical protein [Moorena sp. SIOASIH]NEO97021.1 hypothetical protein [Moorena sp. SIO3G5]
MISAVEFSSNKVHLTFLPYSLLPTPYSLFPVPCSLITIKKFGQVLVNSNP